MALGKVLVAIGLLIAAAGALVWLGVPLGRLPGDVLVRRGAFTFYVPVTTAVLASIVITIVLAWLRR
jgi:hypothetical protein